MDVNSSVKEYAERKGAPTISANGIARVLLNYALNVINGNFKKVPAPCFVGASGIGKSYAVTEAAEAIAEALTEQLGKTTKVAVKTLFLSQRDQADLGGIPFASKGFDKVALLPLGLLPDEKTDGKYGILFLDEINLASTEVVHAVFELLTERKIGEYELPDGWVMVLAGNPAGSNYGTVEFTPAMLRRMSLMCVQFDPSAFYAYIARSNFNKYLSDYLKKLSPDQLLEADKLATGSIFANPASWEAVNQIVTGLESYGRAPHAMAPMICGLVGKELGTGFLKYWSDHQDNKKSVDHMDLLENFSKNKSLREDVRVLVDTYRFNVLTNLNNAIMAELFQATNQGNLARWCKSLSLYLDLIPEDMNATFHSELSRRGKSHRENGNTTDVVGIIREGLIENPRYAKKLTAIMTAANELRRA